MEATGQDGEENFISSLVGLWKNYDAALLFICLL